MTAATGHQATWGGGAGAFAGGFVAGALSVLATPIAGAALGVFGITATGAALTLGTAAVNTAGGAISYYAAGATENFVDNAEGKAPTFTYSAGGLAENMAVSGALSPLVGNVFPVSENTNSTLLRAGSFMPGRTLSTVLATTNARNMYAQALISVGIGGALGSGFAYSKE